MFRIVLSKTILCPFPRKKRKEELVSSLSDPKVYIGMDDGMDNVAIFALLGSAWI